jgi:uncharacterized protein (TIRG00374 family)
LIIIKIIIAILLMAFIINYVSSKEIYKTLKQMNLFYFIIAFVLVVLNVILLYKKWYVISYRVLEISDKNKIMHSLFNGFAAGIITPFRAGEYLARNISYKTSALNVALATFFDKIFNMLVILFIGLFSLIFLFSKNKRTDYAVLTIFILLISVLITVLVLKNEKLTKLWQRLSTKHKMFKNFYLAISKYRDYEYEFYSKVILFSVFHYFIVLFQYAFILYSFGVNNTFWELIWYSSLVLFGKTIIPPVSFGEVGIREASSVFFAGYFGIKNSVGFNTSVIIFLINLLLPAMFGYIYSLVRKK